MYRADEVSVHRACCERATQSYSLSVGGTICPGLRSAGYHTLSEVVTECLLTRSMLIKMQCYGIYTYLQSFTLRNFFDK